VIAPDAGGAIASFEWNGAAVLRPTGAEAVAAGAVREFGCYPLIPFSNRIAEATLHWAGEAFTLPRYLPAHPHAIHGNGWQRAWTKLASGANHARLELMHEPVGARGREWPFAFRAMQEFALTDSTLTLRLEIANRGDRTFPFGLGWHPYFPRSSDLELGFRAAGVWLTDATCLPTAHTAVPPPWDFSTPKSIGTTTLDHCFTRWQSPAIIRWPKRGFAVELSADVACDHLVVFIPPGRDFIAVEPVTHMTDAFNRAAAGQHDTGTRLLAPGAEFSCTMRFSIVPIQGSSE
jgi:aldose 1-epimerase